MRKPAANSRPWLPRRPQGFSRKEDSMPEYHTHRWTRLSRAFRRQHPLCAECQRKGRITEAEVTDHIIPPWVEGVDFWDASNWQPLCRRCNLAKGARDRIKWPLDTRKGEGGSNLSATIAQDRTSTSIRAHAKFSKNGGDFPQPALAPLPVVQKKAASPENDICVKSCQGMGKSCQKW